MYSTEQISQSSKKRVLCIRTKSKLLHLFNSSMQDEL